MRSERYLELLHDGNLFGLVGAALAAGFALLAYIAGLQGIPHRLWTLPVAAVAGFFLAKLVGVMVFSGSGKAAQSIYMPATTGAWRATHSHIDAMQANGKHRAAADAWDHVAMTEPKNPWPLLRAGEIYYRELGEPGTALERFRLARDLPMIGPEQHLYASQKVIDLHLGPLRDEGRALVELRRLIEKHPDTPEAEGARAAIQGLKAARGGPAAQD